MNRWQTERRERLDSVWREIEESYTLYLESVVKGKCIGPDSQSNSEILDCWFDNGIEYSFNRDNLADLLGLYDHAKAEFDEKNEIFLFAEPADWILDYAFRNDFITQNDLKELIADIYEGEQEEITSWLAKIK